MLFVCVLSANVLMCWCVAATCLRVDCSSQPVAHQPLSSPPYSPPSHLSRYIYKHSPRELFLLFPYNKIQATEWRLSTILTLWNPFMFWALPILILFVLSFKWCFENEHIFQTYFCPTHTFYFVRKTQVNTNRSRNVWFHFSNTLSLDSIILWSWSEPKMNVCRMLC